MRQAYRSRVRRRAGKQCAFSLIEALVAVTILSLALLAFVGAAQGARNATDRGNFYAVASEAAAAKIADVQGGGYYALTPGVTNYTVSKLPAGKMTVTVGNLDGSSSNTYIWQIDVVVSWSAGNGQTAQAGGSIKQSALVALRR